MQKKLIALSIAGALSSGVALAQTQVTIYGAVDMGFGHYGDNVQKGIGSKNVIDAGQDAGNKLGFTGTEDLGNGLKALFTLEAGFNTDDGTHGQDGKLFGRQAFLGLTGNFGTAIAGRLYTPHYSFVSTLDPFEDGTVGTYATVYGISKAGGLEGNFGLFNPDRVDNAIAYVSPSFSGFNVTAAYSNNAFGQEAQGNEGDNRVWAILPRYTNGPIDAGVSYHKIKTHDTPAGTAEVDITNWTIGGSYDFGAVKLSAFYDKNKAKDYNASAEDLEMKSWMVGVSVPLGKHKLLASYNRSKLEIGEAESTAKQWAIGYNYSFSKRTALYAAYADISQDSNDSTLANTYGDRVGYQDGYQNGFQVGLKHTF